MKNAEMLLKNGHDFTELDIEMNGKVSANTASYKIFFNDECIDTIESYHLKSADVMLMWLDKEYEPKILDKVEKKYLLGIIKPFKDEVTDITKYWDSRGNRLFICIHIRNRETNLVETICLPSFRVDDTMYKGMLTNRAYRPEELGL